MAEVRMTKNRWRQLSMQVRMRVDDVTETYAGIIEAQTSGGPLMPVQYGHLRDSVAVEGAASGASLARRRIIVGQFYGLFQHEGTDRGIEGRPFLSTVVDAWRDDYLRACGLVVAGGW